MARKDALRLRLKQLFTAAQLNTLYSVRVPEGELWVIEQIAWEIDLALSGGNTRARLYLEGHGYKHAIEEQSAPAASSLYTYSEPLFLISGERLALDLDQSQASTTVELHATGYRRYPAEVS